MGDCCVLAKPIWKWETAFVYLSALSQNMFHYFTAARLIEHLTYIRSYKNIFQTNLSYIDYMYFKHRHRFWWWLKNTDTEILSQLQTKKIRAYFQTIPFWAEPSVYSKKPSKMGAMISNILKICTKAFLYFDLNYHIKFLTVYQYKSWDLYFIGDTSLYLKV